MRTGGVQISLFSQFLSVAFRHCVLEPMSVFLRMMAKCKHPLFQDVGYERADLLIHAAYRGAPWVPCLKATDSESLIPTHINVWEPRKMGGSRPAPIACACITNH